MYPTIASGDGPPPTMVRPAPTPTVMSEVVAACDKQKQVLRTKTAVVGPGMPSEVVVQAKHWIKVMPRPDARDDVFLPAVECVRRLSLVLVLFVAAPVVNEQLLRIARDEARGGDVKRHCAPRWTSTR